MNIHWEPLREIIGRHERFVLSSHVRPDADAIGSELGLASLLEGCGKTVRIINPSASPPNLLFLDPQRRVRHLGDGATPRDVTETDVQIIVDTSAWQQLSDVGRLLRTSNAVKVVIDHHLSSDDLGAVEFKDVTAEATGSLIVQLAEALDLPIRPEAATPLFAAVATDTGWFRFSSVTGETYRTAGRLIDCGAQPSVIYQMLYERDSLARIHLAGRVLSRVKLEFDGRLAYTTVSRDDFTQTGAASPDTEDLVNECLRIAGTEAAFIAIEQPNQQVKVSFRSRSTLNVAEIAQRFGGGGHRQAAGATLPGPAAHAAATVLEALKPAFQQV